MAKIDVKLIEGYDKMTPDQKLAALEAFEYDDHSGEIERYKNAVSKANSEAAEWKKKHNQFLSEEEQRKAAEAEELNGLKAEVASLREEKTISTNKASLISLGYEDALATETATAMAKGDMTKVFANQKKFMETRDKALRAELLKQVPTPPPGGDDGTMTKEKFAKLGYEGRMKLLNENPTLYSEMTKE